MRCQNGSPHHCTGLILQPHTPNPRPRGQNADIRSGAGSRRTMEAGKRRSRGERRGGSGGEEHQKRCCRGRSPEHQRRSAWRGVSFDYVCGTGAKESTSGCTGSEHEGSSMRHASAFIRGQHSNQLAASPPKWRSARRARTERESEGLCVSKGGGGQGERERDKERGREKERERERDGEKERER